MTINLEQYQKIYSLPSGLTNAQYSKEVVKIFNINGNKYTTKEIMKVIEDIHIPEIKPIAKFKLTIDGKRYGISKNIMKATFNEWIQFDSLVGVSPTEGDIIRNLHKILAIYVRPLKRKWFFFKKMVPIDKIDLDKNAENMLKINIEDALAINVFFYLSAMNFIRNTKAYYLNNYINQMQRVLTKSKSKQSTKDSGGI